MQHGIIARRIAAGLFACGFLAAAMAIAEGKPGSRGKSAAAKADLSANYISGTVKSSKGPEAGVWVIAETADLPTKFRKIVVTDDRGRYLLPDLPKTKYNVWVRGYGLVDSKPVPASAGDKLDLTAALAPDERAAAQYYPPDYWLSLLQLPAKSEFPLKVPAPVRSNSANQVVRQGPGAAPTADSTIDAQAELIWEVKGVCERCHQMGDKSTRVIPPIVQRFSTSAETWERFLRSGQVGEEHINIIDHMGHERGLAMFGDWTDRIEKGEVPPAPPRPEGVERNLVLTVWDYSIPMGFPHDVTTTRRHTPTANAYGPVYSPDWSAGALAVLDPSTNEKYMLNVPLRDESIRKKIPAWTAQYVEYPSPFWGSEVVRTDPMNPGPSMMDDKGRVWFNVQTRLDTPAYCMAGSNNPYAKVFPIKEIANLDELRQKGAGVDYYDPKAAQFGMVDLCFGGGHTAFDNTDTILYITPRRVNGLGWVNTRVWDETHDAEKSQGWCPAVIDYNGDGKTGAFTKPGAPLDPKLDRYIGGGTGYIIAVNPVDGSVWQSLLGAPGKLLRMVTGDNPPETCKSEVYEPPFSFKDITKQDYFSPEGVDIDSNGIVWAALAGSGQLARFDRSKCKVLNGPTATGQQCPEGWTMYQIPGPQFKGTNILADFSYNSWVDRYNTLGLGKDLSVISGSGSDSFVAFNPQTQQWIRLRVPYPMGLFTRSLEGRIDDPNIGWKGRGLWGANETREPWQAEGGKGATPYVVHFQMRPDPLAK